MKRVATWFQKVENFILIITFIVMVLASFAGVINRNFIYADIPWFQEISRYSMIYMALLAAEAGLRDGTQISITAVTDMMRVSIRKIVLIISKLIVIVFSVTIFVTSFDLLNVQISSSQVSPALGMPMFIPYLAIPLSFGIIILVQCVMFIKMIRDLFIKEEITEGGKL
ncbi:MAG TPA: TRAP transporter small permease [Anaerovoracaceae bacterium]|nr:TRAP transporter small permease [Anaerovoracaceae bacterium]